MKWYYKGLATPIRPAVWARGRQSEQKEEAVPTISTNNEGVFGAPQDMPGWHRQGNGIQKTFHFDDFPPAERASLAEWPTPLRRPVVSPPSTSAAATSPWRSSLGTAAH